MEEGLHGKSRVPSAENGLSDGRLGFQPERNDEDQGVAEWKPPMRDTSGGLRGESSSGGDFAVSERIPYSATVQIHHHTPLCVGAAFAGLTARVAGFVGVTQTSYL